MKSQSVLLQLVMSEQTSENTLLWLWLYPIKAQFDLITMLVFSRLKLELIIRSFTVLWAAWGRYTTYMSRRERSASGRCYEWSMWGRAGCSRLPSSAASSPSSPSSACGSRCTAGPSRQFPAQPPCQTNTWGNYRTVGCKDYISGSTLPKTTGLWKGDFQKASAMPGYDSLFTFMFKLLLCPIFSGMSY